MLIVSAQPDRLFGLNVLRAARARLEHADPGPSGEVFDAVDDACRRARIAR